MSDSRELTQCPGATPIGCRNFVDQNSRSLCSRCIRRAERLDHLASERPATVEPEPKPPVYGRAAW